MKNYILWSVLGSMLLLSACQSEPSSDSNSSTSASGIKLISVDEFEAMASVQTDTLFLFNFWATWCKPCVAEMPYFEKLAAEMKSEKFKLVFVSIDKPSQLDKVQAFVEKKQLQSEVVVMDVGKADVTIPRIDKSWDGTIPATLFVDNLNKTRLFYQRDFSYEELKAVVVPLIPMPIEQ